MWKKSLISMAVIIITVSIGYTYQNLQSSINAEEASVFGRMDTVTAGDSYSTNIENGAVSWQAILPAVNSSVYRPTDWLLMTVEPYATNIAPYPSGYNTVLGLYKDSNIKPIVANLIQSLEDSGCEKDVAMIRDRVYQTYSEPTAAQAPEERKVFSLIGLEYRQSFGESDFSKLYTSYEYFWGNNHVPWAHCIMYSYGSTEPFGGVPYNYVSSVRPSTIYDMSNYLYSVSGDQSSVMGERYSVKQPQTTNRKATSTPM